MQKRMILAVTIISLSILGITSLLIEAIIQYGWTVAALILWAAALTWALYYLIKE